MTTPGTHHQDSATQFMIPAETEKDDMAEAGKGGKDGKEVKERIDPKKLPTDPVELLQMQVAEQMELVNEVVLTLRSLPTGGPGGGGGGDSDPDSSDSRDSDGERKARGPKFFARKRKKMRRAIKRISPPTFKGEPGERPEAHLLRALDWFDAIGIVTDKDMLRNFRHTLDGNAREWFADLWDKEKRMLTWDELTNSFSRYFSTQGRSLTHLHNAWKSFTFDPDTMDIEEFIRDIQECGSQLQYGERSVMDMIKSCMPRENYGTLYKMDNLAEVITFCKDAYAITPAERAKKAAQASASGTSTNPFSTIKTKGSPDLAQHLNKLTETLNKIDFKQRPYKPQIYPRGKGRGRGGRSQPRGCDQGRQHGYQGNRGGYQQGYQNQHRGGYRGRQRGGKFDKSPTKRNPRVNSKTKDADKDRCRYCHEIGHWERECPQKKKDESKSEEPKPYGAFSGLSDALPEFYGQAALSMGNPAIGEMYQGITDILDDGVYGEVEKDYSSMEYLN